MTKHPFATALSMVTAITIAAAALCLVWVSATGVRPLIMETGSMSPSMPTGSLILVREAPVDSFAVGDVVAHQREAEGIVRVHRVIDIVEGSTGPELVTAGDYSQTVDLFPATSGSLYVGDVFYSSHVAGGLWKLAPYVLSALIIASALAFVLSPSAAALATGLLIALALAWGAMRTGAFIGIEGLETKLEGDTPVMVGVQTGILPAEVQSGLDGDTVVAQPGELFNLAGGPGAESIEVFAKATLSPQLLVLIFTPTVVITAAQLISKLFTRRDRYTSV